MKKGQETWINQIKGFKVFLPAYFCFYIAASSFSLLTRFLFWRDSAFNIVMF